MQLHIQNYPISSFVFQTDLSQTGRSFSATEISRQPALSNTPAYTFPLSSISCANINFVRIPQVATYHDHTLSQLHFQTKPLGMFAYKACFPRCQKNC